MTDSSKPVSTYQPNKEAIGQLLSMNEPSIVVPDWQRNYSWKVEQMDTFWFDLEKFFARQQGNEKSEYFLGSVVIVRTKEGQLKLLDGQQRLATAAIFLSVVRDVTKTYNSDAAKQIQSNYLVGYDHFSESIVHKLRLNIYDREFFRQLILEERNDSYTEPQADISSHRMILNARKRFELHFANFTNGLTPQEAAKKCMALTRCLLTQMTVISVYSSDEESAADVFETLNDRGIGLSTPDLLRNLIIRRAKAGAEDTVVDLWKDMISFDSDVTIQNFLRHFWVSRYGDVKTQSLYREIKGVVVGDDLDSVELSTALSKSSEIYRQIIRSDTTSKKLNELLSEINAYGSRARILFPNLLALIEVLGADAAVTPANLVHNAFVRHSIIRNLENSPLENILYGAARDLRNDSDVEKFQTAIRGIAPDDASTKTSFETLSITHNGSRRNLLKRLELKLRGTEELDIANPERVHVEHVYPQKPLDGEKIANHDRVVNRLGNLTLLSARLNQQIQNGNFDTKKTELAKSELVLTKNIAASDKWGIDEINARQKELALIAVEAWPI